MNIVFLGDTHFGVRGDSIAFQTHFKEFYEKTFFPLLIENDVKHVIQMGDLFDRRKYINFHTLHEARKMFFDRFEELGITLHTVPGNHDIFYKNTSRINSLKELIDGVPNINVYYEPTTLDFDGFKIDMIPWINEENYDSIIDYMIQSTSPLAAGHFELDGFEVMKGITHHGGMTMDKLDSYDVVISGHFHTESKRGNIHYIGTPYEMTWSDHGDHKGFYMFNTEHKNFRKYDNPEHMFYVIHYDEGEKYEIAKYKNSIIKVIATGEYDNDKFDSFIDSLYSVDAVDVNVIATAVNSDDDSDLEGLDTEDTLTILLRHADSITDDRIDPNEMKLLIQQIYNESLELSRESQ